METPGGRSISGIMDVAVMPCAANAGSAADRRRPFLSHTRYWKGGDATAEPAPEHIRVLHEALRLGD